MTRKPRYDIFKIKKCAKFPVGEYKGMDQHS